MAAAVLVAGIVPLHTPLISGSSAQPASESAPAAFRIEGPPVEEPEHASRIMPPIPMTDEPLNAHRIVNPLPGSDLLAVNCEAAELMGPQSHAPYAGLRDLIGNRVEID